MRRIAVSILLLGLLVASVGAYVQARRVESASDPGWIEQAEPLPAVVGTKLLSARRVPAWLSAPISDARLTQQLSEMLRSSDVGEQTCLVVRRNGELVTEQNSALSLSPASLMKIVTATAVLEKAGPNATFSTEVFVRADAWGAVENNVLVGDIYLVGRGDPVLSTPSYGGQSASRIASTDFTELARLVSTALSEHGVIALQGNIVADESRFPEQERDYAGTFGGSDAAVWDSSVVNENASGPLSALLLNDGYLYFSPSSDPGSSRQNVRANDPARHAADVLSALLRAEGVFIAGQTVKGVAPGLADRVSLGVVESAPMTRIVARMLRYSDNTIAEMLLKEIGRRSDGSARAEAVLGVYDVLGRLLGLSTDGMVINDGSGLSSQNRLTCDLIVELLMRAGPVSPLVQAMSVVGEPGALTDCLGDAGISAESVSVHGGAYEGAAALSGVIVADNGDLLTFATISNSEGISEEICSGFQQDLMAVLTGHTYGSSSADALLQPLPAVVTPS